MRPEWSKNPDLVRRWARRHRRVLVLGAVAAPLLVLAVTGIVRTRRALDAAERQRQLSARRESEAQHLLYAAEMNLAQQAWRAGNAGRTRELLRAHIPRVGSPDLRGFEWYHLAAVADAAVRVMVAREPLHKVVGAGGSRVLRPESCHRLASRRADSVMARGPRGLQKRGRRYVCSPPRFNRRATAAKR